MAKESETQKAILEYLQYTNVFSYRNNSGALKTEAGYFVRFGTKGSPDIVCVKDGRYIGIEVKATKGKQSPDQKLFQQALEEAGGDYILAHSLDDVIEYFEKQKATD